MLDETTLLVEEARERHLLANLVDYLQRSDLRHAIAIIFLVLAQASCCNCELNSLYVLRSSALQRARTQFYRPLGLFMEQRDRYLNTFQT